MYQCVECKNTSQLHHHHVVPKSLGGTFTVPLCEGCHEKAHNRKTGSFANSGDLIKTGIQKRKDMGLPVGKPKKSVDVFSLILFLEANSYRDASRVYGISPATITRLVKEFKSLT